MAGELGELLEGDEELSSGGGKENEGEGEGEDEGNDLSAEVAELREANAGLNGRVDMLLGLVKNPAPKEEEKPALPEELKMPSLDELEKMSITEVVDITGKHVMSRAQRAIAPLQDQIKKQETQLAQMGVNQQLMEFAGKNPDFTVYREDMRALAEAGESSSISGLYAMAKQADPEKGKKFLVEQKEEGADKKIEKSLGMKEVKKPTRLKPGAPRKEERKALTFDEALEENFSKMGGSFNQAFEVMDEEGFGAQVE